MTDKSRADDLNAPYGAPVNTIADLDALDAKEMVEGYSDGYDGDPEPKGNRSRSYWHGWRNGAVDGKHREPDQAQAVLARLVVARNRARATDERSREVGK